MTEELCRHRMMQWCISGIGVEDDDSGRSVHMAMDPLSLALQPVPDLESAAAVA